MNIKKNDFSRILRKNKKKGNEYVKVTYSTGQRTILKMNDLDLRLQGGASSDSDHCLIKEEKTVPIDRNKVCNDKLYDVKVGNKEVSLKHKRTIILYNTLFNAEVQSRECVNIENQKWN